MDRPRESPSHPPEAHKGANACSVPTRCGLKLLAASNVTNAGSFPLGSRRTLLKLRGLEKFHRPGRFFDQVDELVLDLFGITLEDATVGAECFRVDSAIMSWQYGPLRTVDVP